MNITKKHFISFLMKENCLKQFKDYTINNLLRSYSIFGVLQHMYTWHPTPNIIANAFLWSSTKEGYTFWNEIDKKWRQTCFQIIYTDEI